MSNVTLIGPGGDTLSAPMRKLTLVRRVGRPVIVEARVGADANGVLDAWLAAQIARGPVRLTTPLVPSAVLRDPNCIRSDAPLTLTLTATTTDVADQRPHLLPRSRVHHPKSLFALITALEFVVVPSAVGRRLGEVALLGPDGAVIQPDQSDWNLAGDCLAENARLERDPVARALTLTGGNDPKTGTAGRWVVTWLDPRAYRSHDEPDRHTVRFADDDGFPGIWGDPLTPWPDGVAAVAHVTRLQRPFAIETWRAWIERDLPLFLADDSGERFVVGVTDVLCYPGPAWHTIVEVAATGVGLPGFFDGSRPRGWSGAAKAVADTDTKPWVELELPGFEAGANRLRARLEALSDGERGDGGFHLPLFAGSIVSLKWSGRYDDEPTAAGNRRRQELPVDGAYLEPGRDLTARFERVIVEQVSEFLFHCDLTMTVDGKYVLKANTLDIGSGRAGITIDTLTNSYQS